MDFMPLIPFLGVSIPESLVLYCMALVLAGKKESPLFVAALSLMTSLFSYSVRSIPMAFGIHSLLQVVLMIVFMNLFFRLSWLAAAAAVIPASAVLGLSEGIFVPFLARIFSLDLGQIISDPMLRILFTLPHLFFLAALTHIARKRRWRLPLIARLTEANGGVTEGTRRNLLSQTRLFALCLVQALMLTLLNISFYIYTSGVYPSFTLGALVAISSVVLLVSALGTVFVAAYLLKVTEQEARLETELRHVREKHNLNLRLRVERHDFYNHLTVIYGYVKTGNYDKVAAYIENLYHTVRHMEGLLKIDPPELAAVLNAKLEEAKAGGVDFHWQVNMENSDLPLSPEDLTRLAGNLLDNALEAAKANRSPRVDFVLTCNKFGLELKVSNNGNPIPQDARQNIFAAGYTTKDANRHSGLGLYIIKQIIDRHDGRLELKEPENYPGVEFDIYIPWSD